MLEDLKRKRAARRLKNGDGRLLLPFRWWQLFTGRKLFYLELPDPEREPAIYAVDVHLSGKQSGKDGSQPKAHLYVDGRHHAESTLPARLPVDGGTVEVAMGTYTLRRMHYVSAAGREHRLTPDPGSAIGRRLRFDRNHPMTSRAIGAISVVMLVIGVILVLLQIVGPISEVPPLMERFGRFESPVQLPLWLNLTLGFGAAIATMERGLRLRYHWLLDGVGT